MVDVLWRMLPVVVSVMVSPIAILAVLGMLQSRHPLRINACYLGGWAVAAGGSLVVWLALLHWFGVGDGDAQPGSVRARVLHAVIAAVCFAGSAWMYRSSRSSLERVAAARSLDELTAATPQLPGILKDSPDYGAGRSFLVGTGVFVLNATNAPLVAATAIDLLNAHVSTAEFWWLCVGFVVAACLPLAAPVVIVAAGRRTPDRIIAAQRKWVLSNGGFLRAAMLLIVGVLQLSRAVTGG